MHCSDKYTLLTRIFLENVFAVKSYCCMLYKVHNGYLYAKWLGIFACGYKCWFEVTVNNIEVS